MLYLLRHADAVSDENDDVRQLSAAGRAQVRRLAAFLGAGEQMQPDEIWHSPLAQAGAADPPRSWRSTWACARRCGRWRGSAPKPTRTSLRAA